MPECVRIDTIDIVLGVVLGRLIVMLIESVWLGLRERHNDGSTDASKEP
jgi:hypothetical protein